MASFQALVMAPAVRSDVTPARLVTAIITDATSHVDRMDVSPRDRDICCMRFRVERLDLLDEAGGLVWATTPLLHVEGDETWPAMTLNDGVEVLAAAVARDGGVELGVIAMRADGEAVMIARKGQSIYAVRAIPQPVETSRPANTAPRTAHRETALREDCSGKTALREK